MPPALRSSAPTTPRAAKPEAPTSQSNAVDASTARAASKARDATAMEAAAAPAQGMTTPRKSPRCKTCGQPRKGHPLRSCDPDIDTPLKPRNAPTSTRASTTTPKRDLNTPTTKRMTPAAVAAPGTLITALSPLALEERDRQEKRERRKSRALQQQQPADLQSLQSISTLTGEMLEMLLRDKDSGQAEDLDEGEEVEGLSEKLEAVVRWRDTSETETPTRTGKAAAVSTDVVQSPAAHSTPTKTPRSRN